MICLLKNKYKTECDSYSTKIVFKPYLKFFNADDDNADYTPNTRF